MLRVDDCNTRCTSHRLLHAHGGLTGGVLAPLRITGGLGGVSYQLPLINVAMVADSL